MANDLLSKITIGGVTYDLKDAQGRQDLANLISNLGTAAYINVAATINDATLIPNASTVKDYVDAQVQTINKFDVRVYDELPTASADTMYILALVAEEGSETGSYVEDKMVDALRKLGAMVNIGHSVENLPDEYSNVFESERQAK